MEKNVLMNIILKPSNVWFDRAEITIDAPELKESIDAGCELVNDLIKTELDNGIPLDRIIIG